MDVYPHITEVVMFHPQKKTHKQQNGALFFHAKGHVYPSRYHVNDLLWISNLGWRFHHASGVGPKSP